LTRNAYGLAPGDLVIDDKGRFGLVVFTVKPCYEDRRPGPEGLPCPTVYTAAKFSIVIDCALKTIMNVSDYKVVQT